MSLRIFETDEAKYYLGLGNHLASSEPIFRNVDFSNLDFFVFEDFIRKNQDSSFLEDCIERDRQYKDLFRRIEAENPKIRIYGVDISNFDPVRIGYACGEISVLIVGLKLFNSSIKDLSKKMHRRSFLKGLISSLVLSDYMQMLNTGETEVFSIGNDFYNIKANIPPLLPDGSLRDAVISKKISEYLVPKHKKEGQKVKAGLLFGSGHSGIETKLKHPWITDKTLSFFSYLPNYCSKEKLNEVREIARNNYGLLKTIYHNANLF